jgi:hypothetical protein
VVVLLALRATTALACGHCVEDRMAVVYDHPVVARALGARHHVAFCEDTIGDAAARRATKSRPPRPQPRAAAVMDQPLQLKATAPPR